MPLRHVHIAKTGGMSIRNTYPRLILDPNLDHGIDVILRYTKPEDRLFCVVRNPIDRLISFYKFQRLQDNQDKFNNYIEGFKNKTMNDVHRMFLQSQKNYVNVCHHVIRFSHLEEDLNHLLHQYSIPIKPLLHCNNSKIYENVSIKSITPDNLQWLLDFYKQDFEILDALDK